MASANPRSGLLTTLLLTALAAAPLSIAPSVIRGLAAEAWVKHYAGLSEWPRPRRAAVRTLVEKTDLAVFNLAPLPQGSAAAMRALAIAQRLEVEDHDKDAALMIYEGVRTICLRVRDRPFSGPGFAVIEARATALAEAAHQAEAK